MALLVLGSPCDTWPFDYITPRAVPACQMVTVMLRYGAAVGVFGGKVDALLDDIAALKPTILAGVPRVFNRVHDK